MGGDTSEEGTSGGGTADPTDLGGSTDLDTPPAVRAGEPQELGAACASGDECRLGNCVNGICCETACAQACGACGPDGLCNIVPQTDSRCAPLACPGKTECQTLTAPTVCRAFGTCATVDDCSFSNVARDTPCGDGGACDGLGACKLALGTPCSSDLECASGTCVVGQCGRPVFDCAQLDEQLGIVIAPGLDGVYPSRSGPESALLLTGTFGDLPRLCFNDRELPAVYNDGFNVMAVVPAGVEPGIHRVSMLDGLGRVTAAEFEVVSAFELGPSIDGQLPVNGSPLDPFVPVYYADIPTITNVWNDLFSDNPIDAWTLTGTPSESNTRFTGIQERAVSDRGVLRIDGQFVVAEHRMTLTITALDCIGSPSCTWDYIALYSCPPDPLGTIIDFETNEPVTGNLCVQGGSVFGEAKRLVLFPTTQPLRQVVLEYDPR